MDYLEKNMRFSEARVRGAAIINSFSFQLIILLAVSVALPSLFVYFGFITVESEQIILNSGVGATFASMAGLITLRRVNDFPGIRSYAYILPSLAAAFGITLVAIFGMRLGYSRSLLTASFVLSVLTLFFLIYLTSRTVNLVFYVVPGGDVETLGKIKNVGWRALSKPEIPVHTHAMFVADFRYDHDQEWERLLARAAICGHVVYHSKLLRESLSGQVMIEHLSENSFGSLVPNLAYHKFKRVADLLLCWCLIPVLILPMLIIAVLIKLDSDGPVIFKQDRVGFRGEIFSMFKFRSMKINETTTNESFERDAAMTRADDGRVTRIGRILRQTRLDELPQIINILRGDMSWIGPRPEAIPLSRWYENEIPYYNYRHIIRPGISGWAQVQQGHVTDLESINEKLAFDFYYIKYFSAWLDIVIALRTIPTMMSGFGAR